jgi:hypothetical protein
VVRPRLRKKDPRVQGFNVLIPAPSQEGRDYIASMVRIQQGFEGLDEAQKRDRATVPTKKVKPVSGWHDE